MSSHRLARHLMLNQKTAWYIQTHIRAEMAKDSVVLQGIIEADEVYIGRKPHNENKKEDREPTKRGRGTDKTSILGAVERGGKVCVLARISTELTGDAILAFIRGIVDMKDSDELMTDEYKAYLKPGKEMKHSIINRQRQFVDGDVHTNMIEGFWSLLKRAWYGSHHHYWVEYTPLYVAEACYKYNYRNDNNIFDKFLNEAMQLCH